MTCLRSGNRWMLDVEQQQTPRATLWQSTSSSAASRHHSHFLCSRMSVIKLLWCSLPVTCLAVSSSISRFFYPPISYCLFLSFPPTLSTWMLVFSLSSSSVTMQPETLSKPPVGNVGPQAAVWCQHMCTLTLVPSLCVTLLWMPRHFVLPVTINSRIITRLNTSHLQPRGFY